MVLLVLVAFDTLMIVVVWGTLQGFEIMNLHAIAVDKISRRRCVHLVDILATHRPVHLS